MAHKARGDQDWGNLSLDIRGLFTPAAPISNRDLFAGRTVQLERLVDAVAEIGRHGVLYGERGVGKTSLANIFHQIIGDKRNTSMRSIRKQAGPADTYTTLWRKVFRDLHFQTRRSGNYGKEEVSAHNIADLYPESITPDDVVRELSGISEKALPIVIFDEFDKLDDGETKKLMSHTIKALSDAGLMATIILVGVADDIDTLVEEHQSIIRNITEIKMPRMSRSELSEILEERYQKLGMKILADARWKIVALSRGLPEYVHALGRGAALNAVAQKRTKIVEADVDEAIKVTLMQSDQSTNTAYKKAIASNKQNALYRQVLLACALTKSDDEGKFTAKDVVEPLSGILGRRIDIANFQAHLAAFCEKDRGPVLERLGKQRAYKYRFREPKTQPYVIMQGIANGDVDNKALEILSAPEQPRLSSDF